jgi:hypothetical protein
MCEPSLLNGVNFHDIHVKKLTLYCPIYAMCPLQLSSPQGKWRSFNHQATKKQEIFWHAS